MENLLLPLRQRLTFRILASTLIGLMLTLSAVGYTLLLSWQLEGGAAAINEAGTMRMRSYKLLSQISLNAAPQALQDELNEFRQTFMLLHKGDPQRPLFLPASPAIQQQLNDVEKRWQQEIQRYTEAVLNAQDMPQRQAALSVLRDHIPLFVGNINLLVSAVETELAEKTTWLRLCQTALIFMSLAASVAVLYLLFLWIISPVNRLQQGIALMTQNHLDARVEVDSEDEFGELAKAFNQMADKIQTAQRTLEDKVAEKTAKLRSQNHEMATLYEIGGFLAGPHTIEELSRGFLARIMQRTGADGGTVRILDGDSDNLHLTVHEGISEDITDKEHCMKVHSCFCGEATRKGVIVIQDLQALSTPKTYLCNEEGFHGLAVFQITAMDKVIGSFSLHFRETRLLTAEERRLLETLSRNLGTAIENQRLIAKELEYAVSQERNLMAQGLHDSIAQGLNFLNLQVQMLEDSQKRGQFTEVEDIIPLLRAGVQESYEDVRELLLNFRTRLQESDFEAEVQNVLKRFERQTAIQANLEVSGQGAALGPEQQLQVLFILQEALSNIRKHAQADQVLVSILNERDFSLRVEDNGRGFSAAELAEKGDSHVGLRIMQERAAQMSATLDIQSASGEGTRVILNLTRHERRVA